MKLKLYAVKDVIGGYYMQPTMLHNDAEAKRVVSQSCSKWEDQFKDYQLYYLGQYDIETGRIYAEAESQFICNFIDFKKEGGNK